MKYTYLALFAALAITACDSKEPEESNVSDKDTVVVHDTVTVKEETKVIEKKPSTPTTPPTTPPAEPKKKPWVDKMAEYHALRCRQHNNQGTPSDRVDQVVMLKDLKDIRNKLNKDERFYFDADMVKAEDMTTCGK